MDVVRALREKQSELGLELQQDFAALLGISHSHLSLLYSGKREPGAKVILRMIELWPDIFSGDGQEGKAELGPSIRRCAATQDAASDPGEGNGERHPQGD